MESASRWAKYSNLAEEFWRKNVSQQLPSAACTFCIQVTDNVAFRRAFRVAFRRAFHKCINKCHVIAWRRRRRGGWRPWWRARTKYKKRGKQLCDRQTSHFFLYVTLLPSIVLLAKKPGGNEVLLPKKMQIDSFPPYSDLQIGIMGEECFLGLPPLKKSEPASSLLQACPASVAKRLAVTPIFKNDVIY